MDTGKNSPFLRGLLLVVLLAAVFVDVSAGMHMMAGREYAVEDVGNSAAFFVSQEETGSLLDGYIRLFEEYMEIGSLITEDGDIDYDKKILVSLTDEKSYTVKELLKYSANEGVAAAQMRDYMENFQENCREGRSYPWYTRRVLQTASRVILEDGNIYCFESPNAKNFTKRKIWDMQQHQKNMTPISTDDEGYEENLGNKIRVQLSKEGGKELEFHAQSAYEGYLITYFPEYAKWYFLNQLAEAYVQENASERLVFQNAYKKYSEGGQDGISEEAFFQLVSKQTETYLAEIPEDKVPWSTHVIPRNLAEAGKYATFLVETYQELRYLFSRTGFFYAYENSKSLLLTNHEELWDRIKEQVQKPEGNEVTAFLYAYYYNGDDEGKTNFPEPSLGMSGNVLEKLRTIGKDYGGTSFQAAVGLDVSGILAGQYEDVFYEQYINSMERQQMFAQGKKLLPISGIVTLLAFLLLAVFCSGSREMGEAALLWYDRIWLELQLVVGSIFVEMILWLIRIWDESAVQMMILIFGVAITLFAFFLAVICLSIIKRQKLRLSGRYSLLWLFFSEVLLHRMGLKEWCRLMGRRFALLPAGKRYTFLLVFETVVFLYGVGCLVFVRLDKEVTVRDFSTSPMGIAAGVLGILFLLFLLFWQRRVFQGEEAEQRIIAGTKKILEGDFAYQLSEAGEGGCRKAELVKTINQIGEVLEQAVEESVRNERMKTELIANVSHDIKTPLTSVINYVDLIKRRGTEDAVIEKYIQVLERKSQRLKTLIDDLVEASKASSGVMELEMAKLDFNELIRQTNGEFEDRFEECQLELVSELPEETLFFEGDGRRVFRVLENLYNNAAKYAMPGTRIYISLQREGDAAVFSMKNISAARLNITPEELTERFVRGDRSRTTEGSGLGLSIAKSLTELMGGSFAIELDGDLFCAKVSFPFC